MHDIEVSDLKAPFPYFGGKSKVTAEVWKRFGKTDRYIEPFFGSGAVMLANPNWQDTKEIVNDLNHYIANCWRAIRFDPEAVAYWCDYPTIEIELHLWHIWLVNEGRERIAQCEWDENHYDAEVAGKWLYGMANWIGGHFAIGNDGGWTRDRLKVGREYGYNLAKLKKDHDKDETSVKRKRPHLRNDGQGVNRKRPHLRNDGQGVNRKLPHLRNDGQGVNRKLPHLRNDGQGVNRQLPHLSDDGRGVDRQLPHLNGRGVNRKRPHLGERKFVHEFFPKNEGLYQYIQQLSERFIEVDVCCGDWERILKPAVTLAGEHTTSNGTAAIFLDPPYSAEAGRSAVYTVEDFSVAHAVRNWCIKNGSNPQMRIALCGYDVEHRELEDHGWEAFTWSANGGYSTFANKDNASHANKHREVIWFSPHCLNNKALPLFG